MNMQAIEPRLREIAAITFARDIREISASMGMVLSLYEVDDDPRIIAACKAKLEEGVACLEALGQAQVAAQFRVT